MNQNGPYTEKVIEHFKNPKNYGKIKNPSAVGKVGNIVCGDVMWIYIRVKKKGKNEKIITDIRFETYGCVAAIATSSVVTTLIKGKSIRDALKIGKEDIIKSLGGLPKIKQHCSLLAVDGLNEAIYNYLSKKNESIPDQLKERHRRIKEEKERIRKKYKDWVAVEEKMHQR